MTGNLAVTLRGVDKRFGATHAVRDLDLALPEGSLVGFLGPNGAGKSTTIRMIMSIIYPDAGAVEVLGSSALKNKDRIGYLPEERGLYRKMRVGEFLEYLARLKGLGGGRGTSDLVKTWLERIELSEVYKKRCQELSKGMQQKVQFLAAIIHEPDLVILDEPFSGLDPVNADLLNRLVRELNESGRTVIFSTHVLHQAEQICDRIVLINHGQKILDATLEEIHARFDPRTIEVEPLRGEIGESDVITQSRIAGVEGVDGVAPLEGGPNLEISVRNGADPQDVMQRILAAQPLRSIRLRRLSLEEVFVHHVRDDEGEAAAALAREELSHV